MCLIAPPYGTSAGPVLRTFHGAAEKAHGHEDEGHKDGEENDAEVGLRGKTHMAKLREERPVTPSHTPPHPTRAQVAGENPFRPYPLSRRPWSERNVCARTPV